MFPAFSIATAAMFKFPVARIPASPASTTPVGAMRSTFPGGTPATLANTPIPPPPLPPFDIETFEPIEPPWQAIRQWIPAGDDEQALDLFDQRVQRWKPLEIPLEDGSILVLDSD